MHSLYVRDQWQVNRKLTLSLGTRWEYFPMPTRVDRGLENYNPATNKMEVCGVGVVPLDCGVEQSKRLFAPRVGVAWRAKDDFIVRMGYGITIDPYSLARPMRTNYPLLVVLNIVAPNAFQPAGRLSDGIPLIPGAEPRERHHRHRSQVAANSLEKDYQRGYVQSWNFTVQKSLPWKLSGQAGYVATRQINQVGFRELNVRADQWRQRRARTEPGVRTDGRDAAGDADRQLALRQPAGVVGAALRGRLATRLFLHVVEVHRICCSENSDGLPAIQLPEFYNLNRAVTASNVPHNLQMMSVWELPFGRGKKFANAGGPASWIAGGWQVNGILSAEFGLAVLRDLGEHVVERSRQHAARRSSEGQGGDARRRGPRPVVLRSVRLPSGDRCAVRHGGLQLADRPRYRESRSGRVPLVPVTERWSVQFRAEAFNATNTPHFANPGNNVSNLQLNADGSIRALGGYTEITGLANTGRDGIDERVFRFGLRIGF